MNDNLLLENLIRSTNNRAGNLQLSDWVPMSFKNEGMTIGLQHIIQLGEDNNVLLKGSKILDLGSGNGTSSLIWANAGYDVTGIELHSELVEIAQDAVLQANNQSLINTIPEFYCGSYFPKKYIDMRDSIKSKAVTIENKFIEEGMRNKFEFNHYIERFHPVCFNDVYESNKILIKEFDVFYAYVWPIQSPSIIELFSLYAREDAKLCLINCYDPKRMCKLFNLTYYNAAPFFLTK